MNIWGACLKIFGWKVNITAPRRDKCVICVAPHTSNWDFILGLAAYKSLGRNANFLMKEFWFFFPLKYLLKHLGGIPVPKRKPNSDSEKSSLNRSQSLTKYVISKFNTSDNINLAVTPEGTRSLKKEWRTGFLYIAYGAGVPIQLGVINYATKTITIDEEYMPTGDVHADMEAIKRYYSKFTEAAKYPEKFTV